MKYNDKILNNYVACNRYNCNLYVIYHAIYLVTSLIIMATLCALKKLLLNNTYGLCYFIAIIDSFMIYCVFLVFSIYQKKKIIYIYSSFPAIIITIY